MLLSSARWSPDGQFIAAGDRAGPFAGIILYSLRTRRVEKLSDKGASPHWTPDGKKLVYFEREDIRVLDLRTRAVTTVPFKQLPGEPIDLREIFVVCLSREGETLYVQSTSEQSDIWFARFPHH